MKWKASALSTVLFGISLEPFVIIPEAIAISSKPRFVVSLLVIGKQASGIQEIQVIMTILLSKFHRMETSSHPANWTAFLKLMTWRWIVLFQPTLRNTSWDERNIGCFQ